MTNTGEATDRYFKAVKEGDLSLVKKILIDKSVRADAVKVFHCPRF